MAIIRKKTTTTAAATDFISKAPDAAPAPARKAGKRVIISVSITPDLLARTDNWAAAHGMSRAATIAYAVSQLEN